MNQGGQKMNGKPGNRPGDQPVPAHCTTHKKGTTQTQ